MSSQKVDIQTIGLDRIAPFFRSELPNQVLLYSVLEGKNVATVVVDNLRTPSFCVLKTEYGGLAFFTPTSVSLLPDAIQDLRVGGQVILVWPSDLPDCMAIPDGFHDCWARLEFSDREPADKDASLIPDDCEIKPIDADLWSRCEWQDEYGGTCQTPDGMIREDNPPRPGYFTVEQCNTHWHEHCSVQLPCVRSELT